MSRLWIYPIKSCRGIPVDQLTLDDRGPLLDRRWMLVDHDGCFLTQREHPRMTLIQVAIAGDEMRLSAPGMTDITFAQQAGSTPTPCVVWNDTVELLRVGEAVDEWLSDFLGIHCSLMRMPASTERVVDRTYSPETRLVTLADAFPMLLISTGSIDLLNEKLAMIGEQPITMERFRPNIEVSDERPHVEDEWRTITIGAVECAVVKPCSRCAITTVDLATAVPGKEPLRTLASYRKVGAKVLFGQNVIHARAGVIRAGDEITVLAWGESVVARSNPA